MLSSALQSFVVNLRYLPQLSSPARNYSIKTSAFSEQMRLAQVQRAMQAHVLSDSPPRSTPHHRHLEGPGKDPVVFSWHLLPSESCTLGTFSARAANRLSPFYRAAKEFSGIACDGFVSAAVVSLDNPLQCTVTLVWASHRFRLQVPPLVGQILRCSCDASYCCCFHVYCHCHQSHRYRC